MTTTFGLGQGQSDTSGGGGGEQTFLTSKEGRIFLRGNFLNKLQIVPA